MTFRKRRILAALLALALCLSLLPMSALAAEADALGETGPEEAVCTCTAPCTEGGMNTACPVCGAERAAPEDCGQSLPQDSGEPETRPLANEGISLLADTTSAKYLDKKGQEQTCPSATVVTESDTSWGSDDNAEHWYVVNGDVTIGTRVTVTGDVHLILADGCNLTVNGGINVSEGNSLTIYAQSTGADMGALTANGAPQSAGIGGGDHDICGTIIINGGIISANALDNAAAGIGCGWYGKSGTIIINGGKVVATSSGYHSGAGIGGCRESDSPVVGPDITINGGEVTATGGNYSAGIGGGWHAVGGTITINGGTVTAYGGHRGAGIGGGSSGAGGDKIEINGGIITATGGSGGGNALGGGHSGSGGIITVNGGTILAKAHEDKAGLSISQNTKFVSGLDSSAIVMAESIGNGIDLSGLNGIIKQGSTYTVYGSANLATNLEIQSGETMQIDAGKTLTISEGITLTNEGAIIVENGGALVNKGTIDGSGNVLVDTYYLNTDNETADQQANLVNTGSTTWTGSDPDGGWYVVQGEVDINSRVNVSGTVNLILADGCNLKINGGINVSSGNSLTIYGQDEGTGALTATGADSQAGIGGGQSQSGGTITINGGSITANSNGYGAGIGGGSGSGGGTITINGGTVDANGGDNAAGIGGGSSGAGGTTIITGGTISAKGSNYGAGIGGGEGKTGGNITISGGTVTATGGSNGAGIGGDNGGDNGTFSTGEDGHAVIFASSISDNTPDDWSGVIFQGSTGQVYGTSATPTEDFTIPTGYTLTIPAGATLDVSNVSVTNNGTIICNGTINGTVDGDVRYPSAVTVSVNQGGQSVASVPYGSTITITATMQRAQTNGINLIAELGYVNFYLGDTSGTPLGTSEVKRGSDGTYTATVEVTLTSDQWKPGSYTITADFGGVAGTSSDGLLSSTGSATLTVTKASQTAPGTDEGYTIDYQAETISAQADYELATTDTASSGSTSLTATPGGTVYVRLKESDTHNPSLWTAVNIPARPDAPVAPSVEDKTDTSITITVVDGVEYRLGTDGSWQTGTGSITFNDLSAGTEYTIYARHPAVTEGENPAFASGSASTQVTTKSNQTAAPTAPTMSSRTTTSVILNYIESPIRQGAVQYGYTTAGDSSDYHWQESTEFIDLQPGTTYTFYARYAETDDYEASPASTGTSIVTLGAAGGDTLADGETITTEDGTNTEITKDEGRITITPGNGGSATVITPDDNVTVNTGDGTVNVPGGSTVQTGDGPEMSLPDGGTVDPDTGAVTPDEGGSVVIDTGDGTTTITPPSGQPVTPNDDGSVTIPGGSTVTGSDGERVTIPPEGGTLQPGGDVEYTVTVTFDSQGGSQVPSQDITVGEPVSQPDDPTRTGYRFLGWYTAATGGARWDFTQPVTGDQTLYAQWAYLPPANPNYKITLGDTENGTVTVNPTAAKEGTTVTITPVPDAGYQVGTVSVTDRFGQAVAVDQQADGTYTFVMPDGQVTVEVTFLQGEAPDLPFSDVTESDWFYDAVTYAYENGLMDGVGAGLFAPNSETTRAQLVTILYRLAGQPAPSGDSGFSDVETGTWYTDAVAWAAQNGIVNGVSDTQFAPGDDITREQLAVILYRYATYQGYDVSQRADLSGFVDAGTISTYAQEALSWANAQGLVLGFEDDSLRPQGNASRAQIAAVLMRFCQTVAE